MKKRIILFFILPFSFFTNLCTAQISSVTTSVTTNVSCNGGSNGDALATVSGGVSPYTYSWSNGSTTAISASNPTGSVLSAGTYTVTVTDNTGNSLTASVTITQPDILSATANTTANISCHNGDNGSASSTVTGGTSPYTYSWTGGAGSNSATTGLTAGTYTLSVSDNNGCTSSATVTITQPNRLRTFASTTNVSCANSDNGSATINVSGGTSPYTYSWSTGTTTNMQTGLSAGRYTVVVSDSCGTSTTANVNIRAPRAVAAFANELTGVTCNGGDNGSAAVLAFNGSVPYTYSWSSGATTTSATGLSAGTYTITVTDSCGGLSSTTVTITQPSALSITTQFKSDTSGTVNCDGSASVSVSGGTSPYTYVWSNLQTTASISNQCSGQYCCVVSDANGCLQSACVNINNATGIDNISNSQSVKFYPDPSSGYFTIAGVIQGQVIELYNSIGQKLSSTVADNTTMYFNIAAQANGIYLVRILNKDGSLFTQNKIVKTQ